MDSINNLNNFNKIENHVYLGDKEAAHCMQFLENYKIKRVLTLRQNPIIEELKVNGVLYKHIDVNDYLLEDILSSFPECCSFIFDGQKNGENVYIHCHSGISRSTSVVIAFLMKKYGYSARESYETVYMKRVCTKPNPGFQYQLLLWEKMLYKLNGINLEYRRFLLTSLRNRIETKVLKVSSSKNWDLCLETYSKAFENYFNKLSVAENNVNSIDRGITYRCKCSIELFSEIDVLTNDYTSIVCDSVYIEPQKWIFDSIVKKAKTIADLMSGDIECYFCAQKLGSFDWERNVNFCECPSHEELHNYWVIQIFSHKLHV